jgi:Inorganic pyrophosphatase
MLDAYSAASRSPCVPLPPPDGDPRQEHLQEFEDVPEFYRLEIHHFCTVYKDLDPGMGVRDTAWADRVAAEADIEASRRRLRAGAPARLGVRPARIPSGNGWSRGRGYLPRCR